MVVGMRYGVKKGFKIPVFLNEWEKEELLKMPNRKCRTGFRNYVMMRLMLRAGLRLSEVINLKPIDVDLTSGEVFVRQGKNNKDRLIYLKEDLLDEIKDYKRQRPESEVLFCTLKGGRLSPHYIRVMVKRLGSRAGIKKNISPHTLRHTFATDLMNKTKNIRLVQKSLGHADISTTMIYTHTTDDDLKEAMRSL